VSRQECLEKLRQDAFRIWHAGVEAVFAARLIEKHVSVERTELRIGPWSFSLNKIRRIAVVGGGKASAAMAEAIEKKFDADFLGQNRLFGWVNVPADCVRPLQAIHLHPARTSGQNEPTAAAAEGAERILQLVNDLEPEDLCLCVISGGASALLPAPIPPITLEDKLQVTRLLSAAGATIEQLNLVRKQISRIKGGGLARSCRAGVLIGLILSDVLGDSLATIGSGPTVIETAHRRKALEVFRQLGLKPPQVPQRVWDFLAEPERQIPAPPQCEVRNLLIGNLKLAVEEAQKEAVRLGYDPVVELAASSEPTAEEVASQLVHKMLRMHRGGKGDCIISGGEPVVRLISPALRGKGGRNQQLVLAALCQLMHEPMGPFVFLSAGTDGEDGPTDAAGAWFDSDTPARVAALSLDPTAFLRRNDAYHFFDKLGNLIKTGFTETNVGDLRVIVTAKE